MGYSIIDLPFSRRSFLKRQSRSQEFMQLVYRKVYPGTGKIRRRSVARFNTKHIFEIGFERSCFGFRKGRFFSRYPEIARVVRFGNDIGFIIGVGTYRSGTFMKVTKSFFEQVQWCWHNEDKSSNNHGASTVYFFTHFESYGSLNAEVWKKSFGKRSLTG
jgi:hypothetical protein